MLSICTSSGVKGIHLVDASTLLRVKKIKFNPAIFTCIRYEILIYKIEYTKLIFNIYRFI